MMTMDVGWHDTPGKGALLLERFARDMYLKGATAKNVEWQERFAVLLAYLNNKGDIWKREHERLRDQMAAVEARYLKAWSCNVETASVALPAETLVPVQCAIHAIDLRRQCARGHAESLRLAATMVMGAMQEGETDNGIVPEERVVL